jgi:hypothetical protein
MENPCNIDNSCFSNIVFENTTLYVPQGTIDKYQATYGWNKFLHIEVNPQNEGITTDVNQIASVAVLIKANGGQLTIEGADDNTTVTAYTLEGVQLGSAVSRNGVATINTNVPAGSIAIVKVADKAVKVVMQ